MKLSVLLVDDEETKAQQIRAAISSSPVNDLIAITHAKSAQAAAVSLRDSLIDLMILDIRLPQHDGEEPRNDGGLRFVESLSLLPGVNRPKMIVGLTAYDASYSDCVAYFKEHGWPLLQFSHESNAWCSTVFHMIIHLAETRAYSSSVPHDFDLAILTALEEPELSSVLQLSADWKLASFDGDDTIYYTGHFPTLANPLRVVACAAIQMGMPATAALAMKVIQKFRPRFLCMAGIAAGVKGNYGDILIADQSWDYGSGKSRWVTPLGIKLLSPFAKSSFDPAPVPILLSAYLAARLKYFHAHDANVLADIRRRWTSSPTPNCPLKVQIGPMASGAAVLENAPMIREIKGHNRKLIGIEMETYAMFIAARVACDPRPHVFSAKSICDFGDDSKDDRWQAYAAFTSAQFIFEFSRRQLAVPATKPRL